MYNCSDIIGFTLFALATIPILRAIMTFFPTVVFFKRIEERYRMSIVHCLAHFVYFKVCFTAMLNWKYSQWLV